MASKLFTKFCWSKLVAVPMRSEYNIKQMEWEGNRKLLQNFQPKMWRPLQTLKKKVIALLKVRIKMQCCFKCRRGSWPLLIFAICLSIAAPATGYLLLIFSLMWQYWLWWWWCFTFSSSFLWWALMWQCWLWCWWWCLYVNLLFIFSSVSIFWNPEPTCSPRRCCDPDAWPRRQFLKQ